MKVLDIENGYDVIAWKDEPIDDVYSADPQGTLAKVGGQYLLDKGFKPLVWFSDYSVIGVVGGAVHLVNMSKSPLDDSFQVKLGSDARLAKVDNPVVWTERVTVLDTENGQQFEALHIVVSKDHIQYVYGYIA